VAEVLSAPYAIEFTYTRSVGPVLERFSHRSDNAGSKASSVPTEG